MASQGRRHALDLRERLRREPYRFGFYQALRLLNLSRASEPPGPVTAGIRFRTRASLAFPASEITRIQPLPNPTQGSGPEPDLEMEVAFMGLTGPSGVLPSAYTELLLERRANRDEALHQFLDVFSHRALCLMAEAWRKRRFCFPYEAGERTGFTQHLIQLTGLAGLMPASRSDLPSSSRAYFAGLMSRRTVPAGSFELMAADLIGAPVHLEQFVGQWLHIPAQDQSRLGHGTSALGKGAVLGSRVWDRQSRIRLRVGPVAPNRLSSLLPGGPASGLLKALVANTLGLNLACDVVLILEPDGIDAPVLGEATAPLGLATWLPTRPFTTPRRDVHYALQS